MPNFSKTSKKRLATCHSDLQMLFNEVIKDFDCTVLYGHRTSEEQFELYKKGRKFERGLWVKTGPVVTYKDGQIKKSKHNYYPSLAIDVVPWYPEEPHIRWSDINSLYYFAGFVKGIADKMYNEGHIQNKVRPGADWNLNNYVDDEKFIDIVHFEIIK